MDGGGVMASSTTGVVVVDKVSLYTKIKHKKTQTMADSRKGKQRKG
jgi:hypothetical protein